MTATTLAAGGERHVPVPDEIARDYLLLGLRLDQHIPGIVDGYFGPADLKAQVDIESIRPPAALAQDAEALLGRIRDTVEAADRRDWLSAQVVALHTQAAALAGEPLPYIEHVTRCFAWSPLRREDSLFEAAAGELDALLPGTQPIAERLATWDRRFEIPIDRLPAIVDWLVARFRARAAALFAIPDGEDLRVTLVRGQPWTAYNWYDGGLRSRVDVNTDLPTRASDLIHTVAHETFPGHHLEHASKEANLVDRLGRLEASALLINTPECLVSEGLADIGRSFVAPLEESAELLVELFERAGLAIAADPAAAREAAERSVAMTRPRRRLSESRVNAALMRHADGASAEDVLEYLERVGRFSPAVAAKRFEFNEHPLWRTYVFVYHEGEALLERWLDAAPPAERADRFGRLLREQLSPGAIAAEIGATERP
ncbi:MAG TPA: hypothetical protein VFV72_06470 [Candidatus Limnocylindrales bacterium]|nr:hypothetical protein [Candidatus Limnocylindrales bacterium]